MPPEISPRDPIDRVAPTARPPRRAVMRQDWHHLLFLHWTVPPDSLRPHLPPGLELDLFDGQAYLGLIPFSMTGVRPVGVPPIPGLSRFLEVNVRTYVHREGRDPGVWFFSLDAANRLAVRVARAWFHLPYHHARMRMEMIRREGGDASSETLIRYHSRRRARGDAGCDVEYAVGGDAAPEPARVGTLDHFLIERYLLYTVADGRLLRRGQVHHAPYPIQPARLDSVTETLVAAAGLERPAGAPLVHYARGVRVEVFGLERVI